MKTDIEQIEHVQQMVDTFYERVRRDELLAPIFAERISDRWPEHLEKMYRFWQTVLLNEHTYSGAPFPPHANMPVDEEHFRRWVELFTATVSDLFEGPVADEAKKRGALMAALFHTKIDYLNHAKSGGAHDNR